MMGNEGLMMDMGLLGVRVEVVVVDGMIECVEDWDGRMVCSCRKD